MIVDLGWIDASVLLALLAIAIAIGFASGRRNKDTESYLLGGRSLPWWAILGSIVATETSTATVLSIPGVAFGPAGMGWLQIAFGFLLGRTLVVWFILPLYFQGKLLTAYQVLEERLGRKVRLAASALFLITRTLGDGLRLFLAALVLQTLLGVPLEASVALIGLITIVYTFFGGLRSVVWNDCIQFLIYMFGGICAVFILVNQIPGGWPSLIEFASESGRLNFVDTQFSLSNPYNLWAGLIGGAVLTIGTHGTDHIMVQRYLGARSQREAGRAIVLSAIVVVMQFALFLWIGVELACFFAQDAYTAPEGSDQVFAYFIVHHFPKNVGLIGLMLAAILAATMSTLSSSLSASVSALLNDFYVPFCKQRPSDEKQLRISRRLTIVFGVLQIGVGIWAKQFGDAVVSNALTIAGFSAGLLLGVFLLGMLCRGISEAAVLLGAAAGLTVLCLVWFVLQDDDGKALVAWPWLALIGSTVTFAIGAVAGKLFPKQREPTELKPG